MYLFIYNYDSFCCVKNAVSIKDAVIQFADYTGCNSLLFGKALKGMETDKEMIDLYNHFSCEHLNAVLKIDEVVFAEEGFLE